MVKIWGISCHLHHVCNETSRKDDSPTEYLQHMIPEVTSTTEDGKLINCENPITIPLM